LFLNRKQDKKISNGHFKLSSSLEALYWWLFLENRNNFHRMAGLGKSLEETKKFVSSQFLPALYCKLYNHIGKAIVIP
jgi:hypothetical protein